MKKLNSPAAFLILITLYLFSSAVSVSGQTSSSVSCANDFVSSQVMTGKVRAYDLNGVWNFLTNGNLSNFTEVTEASGPIDSQWQSRTKALSSDFIVHRSIYDKEGCLCDLRPGDLMIYSLSWEKLGAVAVINSLDTKSLVGDISLYIEGSGKVQRITDFPFSLNPQDAPRRFFRPGLLFLRLGNAKYCRN